MGLERNLFHILIFPLAILISFIRWICRTEPRSEFNPKKKRIGVVGGGIAGCGAAWALKRDGHDVILFEEKASLGGNAKTHIWNYPDKPITGPNTFFRNSLFRFKCIGLA